MENSTNSQTHIVVCSVGLTISTMIITGNILNLLIIPRLSNISDTYKFLLISLAATDLLTGLLISPYLVYSVQVGPGHDSYGHESTWCRLIGYFLPLTTLGDVAIVLCVAMYKYISITRPLHSSLYLTTPKAATFVCVLFLLLAVMLGCCCSLDTFLDYSMYEPAFGLCFISFGSPELKRWSVAIFTFSVFVPAILVCLMYVHMAHISRKQARRIAHTWASSDPKTAEPVRVPKGVVRNHLQRIKGRPSEWKGLRSAVLLTIGFLIAWIPFSITYLMLAYGVREKSTTLMTVVGILVSSTVWWNCIVYFLSSADFRYAAIILFKSTWKRLTCDEL